MTGNFIKARPFDYPYDGRLDPAATALLVIDLQVDFLSAHGYLAKKGYETASLRAILPAVNRVIDAARAAGCLVIFTRQGYRADMADMPPYARWRRKRAGLEGTPALLRSSPGFQIVPEIAVRDTDVIIDKTANGAFTFTDLEQVLQSNGITHLLFTGCTTDVCVHSTLRVRRTTGTSSACSSRTPAPAATPMRTLRRCTWLRSRTASSARWRRQMRSSPGWAACGLHRDANGAGFCRAQ